MGSVASSIGSFAGDIVGGITGTSAQADAAQQAARTQAAASEAGIAEQQRQFDKIVEMMAPYLQAGQGALGQQQALLGLGGDSAAAMQNVTNSPLYQAMMKSGTTSLLQNASATGGLRGGNTQAALGQLAPNILAQAYQQQMQNLGGLSALGQSSAGMQANAGMNTGSNIANLLGQQGAALAGGQMAAGSQQRQAFNDLMGIGGLVAAF